MILRKKEPFLFGPKGPQRPYGKQTTEHTTTTVRLKGQKCTRAGFGKIKVGKSLVNRPRQNRPGSCSTPVKLFLKA